MSGVTTATYIAAAGVAASMAGNYMQSKQNNSSMKAQYAAKNAAMLQGVAQQDKNAAIGQTDLSKTVQGFQAPQQQQDLGDILTNRTNTIAGNMTPSTGGENIQGAPKIVQDDLASKMAKAAAFGTQQAGALAKVGATGDQMVNNNLNLNNGQQTLSTLDDFAKNQARVNQAQQEAAYNNARKPPSTSGQALSTVGNLAAMYGMAGAPGAGGIGDAIFGASPSVTTGAGAVTTGIGGLY